MKIAFIDQAYHEKTKSNDFFKDFLESHFQVDYHWIYTWQDRKLDYDLINASNYDAILFFQVIPRPGKIRLFKCKNLIFVPMYDSVISKGNFNWLLYQIQGVRIISFSAFLHQKLASLRFDVLHVKYYPDLFPAESKGEKLNVFFWQRSDEINWGLIKKLIRKEDVEKFTIRKAFDRDENFVQPSDLEMEEYNIKIVEGWMEKEEYLDLLQACNLFIAPRAAEGIGLSFLEAMSFNIPILAPDAPTMNEYVIHGLNGYLYDVNNPNYIDFSTIGLIRHHLKNDMNKGKKEWDDSKVSILNFIKKRNSVKSYFFKPIVNFVFAIREIFMAKR